MKLGVNNETKTGIFVVICVAVFAVLIMKVGNYNFSKKGYTITSQFHYTGGVKKHAPVSLSGVEVGEVSDINILYGDDTLVELKLWIQDGVKIRKDSIALASTYGLMGEKYIEIQAGTAATEYLKDGESIAGKDSFRLEELVDIGKHLATEIEKTVVDFGQTARDISAATKDFSQTAKDISSVSKRVDGILVDNRKKLDNIMTNFDETSENFREFSDDIKYHPWKILMKGKEMSKEEREKERLKKLEARAKQAGYSLVKASEVSDAPGSVDSLPKQNFSPKRLTLQKS